VKRATGLEFRRDEAGRMQVVLTRLQADPVKETTVSHDMTVRLEVRRQSPSGAWSTRLTGHAFLPLP
jgi:hypothetical protein